jgi:hypothetical protein
MKAILFCLDNCPKCDEVKEKIVGKDIKIINFPHNFVNWSKEDDKMAKEHNVFVDLQTTAPILVLEDGTKFVGQLRILRWLKNV